MGFGRRRVGGLIAYFLRNKRKRKKKKKGKAETNQFSRPVLV